MPNAELGLTRTAQRQTETEEGIARQVVSWAKPSFLTILRLREGSINKGVPAGDVGLGFQKEGKGHT